MSSKSESREPSPREIFLQFHESVRTYDVDKVVSFFAEEGRWEIPFVAEGFPPVLNGRQEIRRFLAPVYQRARQSGRQILGYDSFDIYETTDPEMIISEFSIAGEVSGTGVKYRRAFVQFARIRGGKIVLLRDYFDSAGMRTLPESKG